MQPVDVMRPCGRDEDRAAANPVARVHEQEPDSPGIVVDEKVFAVTDLAILCVDAIAGDFAGAAQMLIVGR